MCVPSLQCLCFGVVVPGPCAGVAQNIGRLPPKVECPEDGCAFCDGCECAFNPCTGVCECCGSYYFTYPCVELRNADDFTGVGGPAVEEISMVR